MNFTELRLLIGNDWGLILLSCILLYMFVLRIRRTGGWLGTVGTIATSVLLVLLIWLQWDKFTIGQEILHIAERQGAGYHMMTREKVALATPSVLELDGVRYVIDLAEQNQKRYLPWELIAIPD